MNQETEAEKIIKNAYIALIGLVLVIPLSVMIITLIFDWNLQIAISFIIA